MCDFAPGDEVVCVEGAAGRFPNLGWVCLVEGAIYTIAEVWREGEIGETGGVIPEGGMVQLVELGPLRCGIHCGFASRRFRKVQRRDLTVWLATENTIEEPKRAPVREPA